MGIKTEKTFEDILERLVAAVGIRLDCEPDGDATGAPPDTASPAPDAAHDILHTPAPARPVDE